MARKHKIWCLFFQKEYLWKITSNKNWAAEKYKPEMEEQWIYSMGKTFYLTMKKWIGLKQIVLFLAHGLDILVFPVFI